MRKIDLLTRASKDIWLARVGLNNLTGDEIEYDVIGYHVQQAVEKLMKFILNERGIRFRKDHFIEQLVEQFEDNGIEVPDWVEVNSVMITSWATVTRYGESLVVVKGKMIEILDKVDIWLQQQQEQQQQQQKQNISVPESNSFSK